MYVTNILEPTPQHLPDIDVDTAFDEIVLDELLDNDAATPVTLRAPQARCADGHGTLTHLFFSDVPLDTARAKAICGKCALAVSCLEGALERAEPWGVWGGELVVQGVVVPSKRPRGRPRKNEVAA